MTSTATQPTEHPAMQAPSRFPQRHRSAEARSKKIGRVLRRVAKVDTLDEALMERIGESFMAIDTVGSELAHAMHLRAGDPQKVSMADFRAALADGLDAVDNPALALVHFFNTVETEPEWVDWDVIERGAQVFRRFGQSAADVMLQLSLIGGYRFGGPPDLLVATGGLTGDSVLRRLAETQSWTLAVTAPGGMRRDADGWKLTVHVRAMHAMVNHSFEPRWDTARWGKPINQSDQAATLGLFDAVPMIGVRTLGVSITKAESLAVMHLWKYVGWLMGVDPEWLVDTELERHKLNYHVLRAQADITPAGGELARAIIDAQADLHQTNLRWLRNQWSKHRLLSMLTMFLGPQSMRELGLPVRLPWAFFLSVGINTVRHQIIGRTPWGPAYLDRRAEIVRDRVVMEYHGPGVLTPEKTIGAIPTH